MDLEGLVFVVLKSWLGRRVMSREDPLRIRILQSWILVVELCLVSLEIEVWSKGLLEKAEMFWVEFLIGSHGERCLKGLAVVIRGLWCSLYRV
jgi:hypothetical protein